MDAQAHLLSLGWAGPGHSLDSRPNSSGTYKQKGHRGLAYDPAKDPLKVGNTGNGLVKPLLVSQRKNRFGVGKKAHEAPAGNEWWLKGFESALGNIGKSESERSSGANTPTNGLPVKHEGLYSFFIKGQIMQGTIGRDVQAKTSRKRKSDQFEEDNVGTSNPRPLSPTKLAPAVEFEMVGAFMRERDREKKAREKTVKAGEAEQFAQIGEFFGAAEKQQRKKKRKSEAVTRDEVDKEVDCGVAAETETKEERRERRRREKEAKAARVAVRGHRHKSDSEDSAAKAARRAERKRRKAERDAFKKI